MTKMCILSKLFDQMFFFLFFILKQFGYKVTQQCKKNQISEGFLS